MFLHTEANASISNNPERKQQVESCNQHARGLSKQEEGNKHKTAGGQLRESGQCEQALQHCMHECAQQDSPTNLERATLINT